MQEHNDGPRDRSGARGVVLGIAAMAVVVTASNILVRYPINDWLTWGALPYPFAFLVTDLTNRRLGPGSARRVVWVGFAFAVVLSAWLATPLVSSSLGSILDTALFFSLAFAGTGLPWTTWALGDLAVKAVFAALLLIPFRLLLGLTRPAEA